MPSIQSVSQRLSTSARVTLFKLDLSAIDGGIHYFTQGAAGGAPIMFGGIPFVPVDVDFAGFDTTGVGALPQPKMKVANTNGVFQALVNQHGDLLGCIVQRIRTYAEFLDGQPNADPSKFYGPDTFRVEQKSEENPIYIEWELSAHIDQEGKQLPGRVVIRDTCLWRYRSWDQNRNNGAGGFDYTRVQCPYMGSSYFDENDNAVNDPSQDKPSRRLTCCEKRFGANNPLPFGGFPGAAKVRQ